jgi:aryl-alcohol dehydrogenase-like predicted oxidoreductase
LSGQGAEIQVRSVFLQGLLAGRFETDLGGHPDVVRFHDQCDREGFSPIEVALGFVKRLPWVSRVVVGVTCAAEFGEIVKVWESTVEVDPVGFGASDLGLLDPRQWK